MIVIGLMQGYVPLGGSDSLLKAFGRDMKEAASKAMWTQKSIVAMTLDSTAGCAYLSYCVCSEKGVEL